MTAQTLKLKNQTLTLPKDWRGKEVFVRKYKDTIVIKKIEKPEFLLFDKDTEKKLLRLGKKITKKDIEEAIRWAQLSSYCCQGKTRKN